MPGLNVSAAAIRICRHAAFSPVLLSRSRLRLEPEDLAAPPTINRQEAFLMTLPNEREPRLAPNDLGMSCKDLGHASHNGP